MKPKNRKINIKPKVHRPKPKKISTKPRKPRRPDPKKYRATKIGKGVKRPRTKNMEGTSHGKLVFTIRNDIIKEKKSQKQNIMKLNKKASKLRNLTISLPGLEELNKSSIFGIQKERRKLSSEIQDISSNLVASAKRLTKLEDKFRTLKS